MSNQPTLFDLTIQVEHRNIATCPGYRVGNNGTAQSCWKINRHELTDIWREVSLFPDRDGYMKFNAGTAEGKKKQFSIHRVVLEEFVGSCPDGMQACHYPDGDKSNNRVTNLRWGTPKDNAIDREVHGHTLRGEKHGYAALTESEVVEIRKMYATGRYSQQMLAYLYFVTQSAIWMIVNEKNWKHLLVSA